MNAIYFKASWTHQFQKNQTTNRPFTLVDGTIKQVPTMFSPDHPFKSVSNSSLRAIDLPYGGAAYSMTVLLPTSGTNVDALISGLDQTVYSATISGLREGTDDLYVPKFTLSYEILMNDVLKGMGMAVAFDPAAADFSKIADVSPERLYISKVKQKTWVDVNEEGTEAAAVTSVEIGITSAHEPTRIDRPFVFVIRERFSGAILFLGKIMDPTVPSAGAS
jgi:serpin B